MATMGPQTMPGSAEREEPLPDAAPEPSIWDTLDDDDRASLVRAVARSRAGIFASDEEVEAAFALFGP